jgi:hypothetical protein
MSRIDEQAESWTSTLRTEQSSMDLGADGFQTFRPSRQLADGPQLRFFRISRRTSSTGTPRAATAPLNTAPASIAREFGRARGLPCPRRIAAVFLIDWNWRGGGCHIS